MKYPKIIEKISRIILSELDNIEQNLSASRFVKDNVFAYPDRLGQAQKQRASLLKTQNAIHNEKIKLSREPFVAYVRAEIDKTERVYYICRCYTPTEIKTNEPSAMFVDYRSPMGRIVELNVNSKDIIRVPGGERVARIFEKNLFTPTKIQNKWDGIRNNISLSEGVYSIPSLSDFLKSFVAIMEDPQLIQNIQEKEKRIQEDFLEKLKIKEGLTREVIHKMELRDQATLDETQGDIFRLPLGSQIILTGAPGTGKTTTLIKRIAQKTDPVHLTEEERFDFPKQHVTDYINEENWVMFTPTELLKIFLKEAFNNEMIPASDKRVKVWDDERTILGRDILKFLKTGDKGYFTKTSKQLLLAQSNFELIDHANAFIKYYNQYVTDLFNNSFEILKNNNTTPKMLTHFSKIKAKLEIAAFKDEEERTLTLIEELGNLRDSFKSKSKEIDEQVEKIGNVIITSKPGLLDEVYSHIKSFKEEPNNSEETDIEEDEYDYDEPEKNIETTEYSVLSKRQIERTIIFFAGRIVTNKKVPKESIHAGVLKIISSSLPSEDVLSNLGKRIVDRKVTNILTRGYSNLLNRVPFYYQKFRINSLRENSFFNIKYEKEIRNRKICDAEIDLIIFIMLSNARKLFKKHKELLEVGSKLDILETIRHQYSTQISVDEATDFSSIQLGCMYHLSHPRFNAVSISGDLMQRITDIGLTDWKQCNIITNTFIVHEVNKVYRQSPKLLKIAEVLYENNVKQKPPFNSAFKPNAREPEPLKFESRNDEEIGIWISDRILEIFNLQHKLPSTAIFVAEDDLVDEAFKIVEEPLNNNSIGVKACKRGEILGSDGKVRIFSIKYIKGLEFESVFFLNINKIAEQTPNLIDKYLYVGLTRAASFLGVVYKNQFPDEIKFIEKYFKEGDWSRFTLQYK